MRDCLRRAISKLGEKSAEMFVLKYYEGYENTEIARLMGTSAMVVGVLLHRARARVKRKSEIFWREASRAPNGGGEYYEND